jgi:hypothetical protein
MGIPQLKAMFQQTFGEPTMSNNGKWLRRKLAQPPCEQNGRRPDPPAQPGTPSECDQEEQGSWEMLHAAQACGAGPQGLQEAAREGSGDGARSPAAGQVCAMPHLTSPLMNAW